MKRLIQELQIPETASLGGILSAILGELKTVHKTALDSINTSRGTHKPNLMEGLHNFKQKVHEHDQHEDDQGNSRYIRRGGKLVKNPKYKNANYHKGKFKNPYNKQNQTNNPGQGKPNPGQSQKKQANPGANPGQTNQNPGQQQSNPKTAKPTGKPQQNPINPQTINQIKRTHQKAMQGMAKKLHALTQSVKKAKAIHQKQNAQNKTARPASKSNRVSKNIPQPVKYVAKKTAPIKVVINGKVAMTTIKKGAPYSLTKTSKGLQLKRKGQRGIVFVSPGQMSKVS